MGIPGYIGQEEAEEICRGLLKKCFDLYESVESEDMFEEKEYIVRSNRLGKLDSEMATNHLINLRTAFEKRLRLYGAISAVYAIMEAFEEREVWSPDKKLKSGLKKAIEDERDFLSGECASSFENEMTRKIGSLLKVDREKEARRKDKD